MEKLEINVLKVAYIGWNFHGSQIQPNLRTVEGVLENVLGIEGKFLSRTDAGVSAISNIYLAKEPFTLEKIKKRISELLKEGIAVWAAGKGKPIVEKKIYLYFLPFNPSSDILQKLKVYEGLPAEEQPVKKGGTPPKRGFKVRLIPFGPIFAIAFEGPGFGYMQIRKIVGEVFFDGKTAPAEGLLLYKILASGVKWIWEEPKLVRAIAGDWLGSMLKAFVRRFFWLYKRYQLEG